MDHSEFIASLAAESLGYSATPWIPEKPRQTSTDLTPTGL